MGQCSLELHPDSNSSKSFTNVLNDLNRLNVLNPTHRLEAHPLIDTVSWFFLAAWENSPG